MYLSNDKSVLKTKQKIKKKIKISTLKFEH